jgi:hypothetical protein
MRIAHIFYDAYAAKFNAGGLNLSLSKDERLAVKDDISTIESELQKLFTIMEDVSDVQFELDVGVGLQTISNINTINSIKRLSMISDESRASNTKPNSPSPLTLSLAVHQSPPMCPSEPSDSKSSNTKTFSEETTSAEINEPQLPISQLSESPESSLSSPSSPVSRQFRSPPSSPMSESSPSSAATSPLQSPLPSPAQSPLLPSQNTGSDIIRMVLSPPFKKRSSTSIESSQERMGSPFQGEPRSQVQSSEMPHRSPYARIKSPKPRRATKSDRVLEQLFESIVQNDLEGVRLLLGDDEMLLQRQDAKGRTAVHVAATLDVKTLQSILEVFSKVF